MNQLPGASLDTATGVFTLPAGRYIIRSIQKARENDNSTYAFRDAATGTDLFLTVGATTAFATDTGGTLAYIELTSQTDVEFGQYTGASSGGTWGAATTLPAHIAVIEIVKIG